MSIIDERQSDFTKTYSELMALSLLAMTFNFHFSFSFVTNQLQSLNLSICYLYFHPLSLHTHYTQICQVKFNFYYIPMALFYNVNTYEARVPHFWHCTCVQYVPHIDTPVVLLPACPRGVQIFPKKTWVRPRH